MYRFLKVVKHWIIISILYDNEFLSKRHFVVGQIYQYVAFVIHLQSLLLIIFKQKDDYVLEFKTFCQTGTICISRVVAIKVVPFSKNIILLISTLSLMVSNQIWRCSLLPQNTPIH